MLQLARALLALMDWFIRLDFGRISREFAQRGFKEHELGAFQGVPKPAIIYGQIDREDLGVITFWKRIKRIPH